jgi:hypothetical protein
VSLRYESIEAQISDWLHELRPAAQRYWEDEGQPGHDPGPYVFVGQVFEPYIEILLAMRESRERDRLLTRAFSLLEAMLSCDDKYVRDLAFIQFLENADPWWLARGKPFLGSAAVAELRRYHPDWRQALDVAAAADNEREIIDLCGVRDIVLMELRSEQVGERDVPGISAPRVWQALPSLETAQKVPGTVAFVSCFGTSRPYVIAPTTDVYCDTATLRRLATDLATCDAEEPDQPSKAAVYFFPIREGERVWQMNGQGSGRHARWEGARWIAPRIKGLGHESSVIDVLAGSRTRLIEDA